MVLIGELLKKFLVPYNHKGKGINGQEIFHPEGCALYRV
jgi:hypothetical protein